jgi:hypothetical protein
MAATACFAAERVAAVVIGETSSSRNPDRFAAALEDRPTAHLSVVAHAIGGAVGGGLTGALYGNRPIQGALFLTPVMAVVGIGQELFDEAERELRLQADGKE